MGKFIGILLLVLGLGGCGASISNFQTAKPTPKGDFRPVVGLSNVEFTGYRFEREPCLLDNGRVSSEPECADLTPTLAQYKDSDKYKSDSTETIGQAALEVMLWYGITPKVDIQFYLFPLQDDFILRHHVIEQDDWRPEMSLGIQRRSGVIDRLPVICFLCNYTQPVISYFDRGMPLFLSWQVNNTSEMEVYSKVMPLIRELYVEPHSDSVQLEFNHRAFGSIETAMGIKWGGWMLEMVALPLPDDDLVHFQWGLGYSFDP